MSSPTEHETENETRDRLLRKIRVEGAEVAIEALIGVCKDAKAPTPAKATAGTSLLRAAGYFNRSDADSSKEPHEMSAAELSAAIRKSSNAESK
jgi:hypothetical protein